MKIWPLAKALKLKIYVVAPVLNTAKAATKFYVTAQNYLESDQEVFILYREDAGHFETLRVFSLLSPTKARAVVRYRCHHSIGNPLQLGSDSGHSSSGEISISGDHEFEKLSEEKSDEEDIPLSSRIDGRKEKLNSRRRLQFIPVEIRMKDDGGGWQLNVDRRFDRILTVESTIIFMNSCRFVDRFLASKTCRL